MSATHTRTFNAISFADQYKVCRQCGRWVDGVLCTDDPVWSNLPCEHHADYDSVCPSWGPVDGCECVRVLGYRPHPPRAVHGDET